MPSVLDKAHFKSEPAAYRWVEARVWPNGRVCPHCGSVDDSGPLKGKSTRIGVYKCYAKECRKPFTVKVGTIFEASHIKLHIWLQAMFLLASSKKGISSNQLARTLGVTLKSAWFLSHRIREAMRDGELKPFGSTGGIVEADETFIGVAPHADPTRGKQFTIADMNKVLSLVDRDTGRARSFVVKDLRIATIMPILQANIAREAVLMTDESGSYDPAGLHFDVHLRVNHSKGEYVRVGAPRIHTNTIEGFFSVFKRGMKGVYQHCGSNHLHRYMAEFDYRYSNRVALGIDDEARFAKILSGVTGKRLTYRRIGGEEQASA